MSAVDTFGVVGWSELPSNSDKYMLQSFEIVSQKWALWKLNAATQLSLSDNKVVIRKNIINLWYTEMPKLYKKQDPKARNG